MENSENYIKGKYLFESDTPERQEQREIFNDWISNLLFQQNSSCLLRDVLRNQKENLFEEWMRVRPYG